jgi:membrane protease YdiL (CAAX protease family)
MMQADAGKNRIGVYLFLAVVLGAGFVFNYFASMRELNGLIVFLPFLAGMFAFVLQIFLERKSFMGLYSKSYPYRKLKLSGWISAFVLFEFVLAWGLSTGQISLQGVDLASVNILLFGTIIYYHLFVRMKISLRFLFMGILIPLLTAGTAFGLGHYFGIIGFTAPAKKIGGIVFLNSLYWMIYSIFFQVVCEEPAFRGYLLQKLLDKGEFFAIVFSSICYGLWRVSFVIFSGETFNYVLVLFIGSCIIGAITALLFLKGRNLLVAALCHGILNGVWKSVFTVTNNPGIREYIEFRSPESYLHLTGIWYCCLLLALILLTFIPRKTFCIDRLAP